VNRFKRWYRAQTAEAEHDYHDDVRTEKNARSVLKRFGHTYESLEDSQIIAVGAGTGIIHRLGTGRLRVGIDPLTSTYFDRSDESEAEVVTGAGERLPFASESFDVAISLNVLDHTAAPVDVLSEINRVLRPDGELLFNLNVFGTPDVVNRYLGLVDRPHPHHYNIETLLELFEDAGLDAEVRNVRTPNSGETSLKRKVGTAVFGLRKIDIVATPG
jgi:SAM-dependent methyltransferase